MQHLDSNNKEGGTAKDVKDARHHAKRNRNIHRRDAVDAKVRREE